MNFGCHESVVVAAGQLQSRLMNEAATTLEAIDGLIREAQRQQVRLLVLPECAYPAYLLGSAESYRAGDHLSSGQFVEWLSRRARESGLHIVCGYVEDTGRAIFNAAVLLGPDGRTCGGTRKQFLWHVDREWFTPGDRIEAFDTELGRIGIIICAEARVPEIIATLAADGAEMIAMPTCWINSSRQLGEFRNPQPEYMIAARAREFGLPFICADKAGLEMTTGYVGQSCIVTADGSMPVKAPTVGDALAVSTIAPAPAERIWASDSRRVRLFDERPPSPPRRTQPCPTVVAAISTDFADARFTSGMGESLFVPLRDQGVQVLLANLPHESMAERFTMLARAFDIHALAFPVQADAIEVGPIRVGPVAGQWLGSFAAGRALALDGAEMLVYFDASDDLPMLRTRAVENRVFVIGVDAHASTIIGPDGTVLASGTHDAAAIVRIDVADASDKLVAPKTDIFAERRPGLYRF